MTPDQFIREAFFLWSVPAVLTAIVSGIGLGSAVIALRHRRRA